MSQRNGRSVNRAQQFLLTAQNPLTIGPEGVISKGEHHIMRQVVAVCILHPHVAHILTVRNPLTVEGGGLTCCPTERHARFGGNAFLRQPCQRPLAVTHAYHSRQGWDVIFRRTDGQDFDPAWHIGLVKVRVGSFMYPEIGVGDSLAGSQQTCSDDGDEAQHDDQSFSE